MNSIASFVISLLAIFFLTVSGSAPAQASGFANDAEDGVDCVCGKTCKCEKCACPKSTASAAKKAKNAKSGGCACGESCKCEKCACGSASASVHTNLTVAAAGLTFASVASAPKTGGCKCCGPNCQCPESCKCDGKSACAKSGKCCNGTEKCCSSSEKKSLKGAQNNNVRGKSEVFFHKAGYKPAKKKKSHCILGAACCKDK